MFGSKMNTARTSGNNKQNIEEVIEALRRKKLATCFDPYRLDSKPTSDQDLIFQDASLIPYRYIVAGNRSGKSMAGAREIAWFLTDTHPYADRKEMWGHEPLLILIIGQDLTMMATELWGKKIKPLIPNINEKLADGKTVWREIRQGNSLKQVKNMNTGDEIVFLSHADGSENNIKHMQGYTAHVVWLDEMPGSIGVFNEAQLRIKGKANARFIATFTPSRVKNEAIKRIIENAAPPYSKRYALAQLDNPGLTEDDKKAELARLANYSPAERERVLMGGWPASDTAVYQFDYEKMTVDKLPASYSKGWRHVVSVDPANKSKCGFTLWAEDPKDGVWFLISDEYLSGADILDPGHLVKCIEDRISGYNIIRRVSDTMAWFIGTASAAGISYTAPYKKNSRKEELIKGLQTDLSENKIKVGRWCSNFLEEVQSCHWKEGDVQRIVNSSSFHTLDASQYFRDCKPRYESSSIQKSWMEDLLTQSDAYYTKQDLLKAKRMRLRRW